MGWNLYHNQTTYLKEDHASNDIGWIALKKKLLTVSNKLREIWSL